MSSIIAALEILRVVILLFLMFILLFMGVFYRYFGCKVTNYSLISYHFLH